VTSAPMKVTPEMVRGVMDRPPQWLAASYIPAYQSGRYSTEALALGVVAACGGSAYDDEAVVVATNVLANMGYGGEASSSWA
jgi:hypothetical protein